MTTEILDAPTQTAVAAYQPFYAELAELEKSNTALAFNYETPKGNKEARSHVYKLRQTKGALERTRVEAKAEYLRLGRAVDSEAKVIESRIDAMIGVHQTKLDEIENREKDRIQALKDRLEVFDIANIVSNTVADVEQAIADVNVVVIDETWQEFMAEAKVKKDGALVKLRALHSDYVKRDAEAAELARLRAEALAREQRERDAAIAAAAAEQARKEEVARAEAAAAAARKQIEEAAAAAKAAAEAAERREAELKAAAAAAERRRIEAAAQAERDAAAAAERAEQEKQRAIQAEKDRLAAEAAAAAQEQAKREADIKHRGAINGAALAAIVAAGIDEEIGKKVITLIAQRKVPHVSISY